MQLAHPNRDEALSVDARQERQGLPRGIGAV